MPRKPLTIEELYARPGELILPKWLMLLQWAKQFRLIKGPGIELDVTPEGTRVRAKRARGWPSPFRVGLGLESATVGRGLVNGKPPTIAGVPIDGFNAEGERITVPPLDLRAGMPAGGNGDSWVGIDARGASETEPAKIAHLADAGEGHPSHFQPLALIEWEGGRPVRKWQIVRHHLNFAEVEGRFYFWAV